MDWGLPFMSSPLTKASSGPGGVGSPATLAPSKTRDITYVIDGINSLYLV